MGHLTGARTKRQITSVEVVSDDSQRVLRFIANESGSYSIEERAATDSEWSFKPFATIAKEDAAVIAVILKGGDTTYDNGVFDRAKSLSGAHKLPEPESAKDAEGDCTPLDIERAKAANLQEAKQLVQLEMERDHSLDRHVGADVPGCPACERKVIPSVMPPTIANVQHVEHGVIYDEI